MAATPAEYAPEEDTSDYLVPLSTSVVVGVDPLKDKLATVYDQVVQHQIFLMQHIG